MRRGRVRAREAAWSSTPTAAVKGMVGGWGSSLSRVRLDLMQITVEHPMDCEQQSAVVKVHLGPVDTESTEGTSSCNLAPFDATGATDIKASIRQAMHHPDLMPTIDGEGRSLQEMRIGSIMQRCDVCTVGRGSEKLHSGYLKLGQLCPGPQLAHPDRQAMSPPSDARFCREVHSL